MKNELNYYLTQSLRSEISTDFSKSFGTKPEMIMKNVRKKLFHPCELKDNLFASNWPRFTNAKDIENECYNQKWVCGKCREFTLLCVSLFRANGIPARSRCGFGIYFSWDGYGDHWVVEYWNKDTGKWQLADAQKKIYNLENGKFINGAIAWQLYRKYDFSSSLFGFDGFKELNVGAYYIVANLIRDMKGLLKNEPMYTEELPIMKKDYNLNENDLNLLDDVSDLILQNKISDLVEIDKKYFNGV
jgi:hypothetical protein